MTLSRQVASMPITPTLARTQCTSHTEVVHVVGCGAEEIGEESTSTSSKSKVDMCVATSCVTHHVLHCLTHSRSSMLLQHKAIRLCENTPRVRHCNSAAYTSNRSRKPGVL